MKRSIEDAMENMAHAKIRCWNRTHKKMKWKLALRIATSPSERWLKKAAEWNRDLSPRYRTNRAIGRPKKDGKVTSMISSNKLMKKRKMKTQSREAIKPTRIGSTLPKTGEGWALLERDYTMTV